jgi:DNA-binding protein H-NS
MATQTYAHLKQQIAALETQAAKAKSEETAGVVAKIKVAITSYGLTPQDLFGGKSGIVKTKANAKSAAKGKTSTVAKYIDGKGGQWVGRGKRPRWLSDALAAGKQLEDFLAEKFKAAVETFSSPPAEVVAPAERPAAKKSAKKPSKQTKKAKPAAAGKKAASSARASYADGAGNSWTGMGPTPKWLKAAIAGGKSREDFLVKN